jgi:hypothetical protein
VSKASSLQCLRSLKYVQFSIIATKLQIIGLQFPYNRRKRERRLQYLHLLLRKSFMYTMSNYLSERIFSHTTLFKKASRHI